MDRSEVLRPHLGERIIVVGKRGDVSRDGKMVVEDITTEFGDIDHVWVPKPKLPIERGDLIGFWGEVFEYNSSTGRKFGIKSCKFMSKGTDRDMLMDVIRHKVAKVKKEQKEKIDDVVYIEDVDFKVLSFLFPEVAIRFSYFFDKDTVEYGNGVVKKKIKKGDLILLLKEKIYKDLGVVIKSSPDGRSEAVEYGKTLFGMNKEDEFTAVVEAAKYILISKDKK